MQHFITLNTETEVSSENWHEFYIALRLLVSATFPEQNFVIETKINKENSKANA